MRSISRRHSITSPQRSQSDEGFVNSAGAEGRTYGEAMARKREAVVQFNRGAIDAASPGESLQALEARVRPYFDALVREQRQREGARLLASHSDTLQALTGARLLASHSDTLRALTGARLLASHGDILWALIGSLMQRPHRRHGTPRIDPAARTACDSYLTEPIVAVLNPICKVQGFV